MNANISARLLEAAGRHAERPALVEWRGGRRRAVTYGELARTVETLAGALRARGLAPGERALLLVPMSIELYAVLLAVLHAGAVAVFVDAWAGWERIDAAARRLEPRLLLAAPRARLLQLVSAGVRAIPETLTVRRGARALSSLTEGAHPIPAEPLSPGAPALVTFTTGSTGAPKAAVRSHGFLWDQHVVLSRHVRVDDGDVDMPTLPIFVLHNLASGATSVLPDFDPKRPAEIDPKRIREQMVFERVVSITGSPAFFERLLRGLASTGERLPLERAYTGGAPVLPGLAVLLEEHVRGKAWAVYGSTEAEPVSLIEAAEMRAAMAEPGVEGLCVGPPVPEIEVRLIRPTSDVVELDQRGWAALECQPGEAGEITVAGPQVQHGYFDDATADRASKIADGAKVWHRTGDGGKLDARGRLWLMGRVSTRVLSRGQEWWSLPAEIRALGLEGVTHAAYLGDGDQAILCVEGAPPGTEGERVQAARDRLAPYPVDRLRVLRRMPRDPRHASKTDLRALRKQIGLSGDGTA